MALINYGSTVGRRGPVGPAPMRAPRGGNAPPTTTPPASTPAVPAPTFTPTPDGTVGSQFGGRTLNTPRIGVSTNQAVIDAYGADALPQSVLDTINETSFIDSPVGYSGGGGETTAERLAREAAIRGAGNQASYLSNLLTQAPNQYKTLLDAIAAQRTDQEANVKKQYDTAIQNLKDRLAGAQTTTTAGYNALREYLGANAPSAYSQLPQAQAPTLSPDAVLRYAQAIGAPTQAIGQAAVQAAAPYAGTADAYNRLLKNLQAAQTNAQDSRMAEERMARTLADQGLTAQSTAQQNTLEGQRAAALDTILRQIQGQQLGIQQGQLGYEQGLRQALAGVYGTGYVAPPPPRNAAGEIDLSGVDFNALGRLMGLNK